MRGFEVTPLRPGDTLIVHGCRWAYEYRVYGRMRFSCSLWPSGWDDKLIAEIEALIDDGAQIEAGTSPVGGVSRSERSKVWRASGFQVASA